MLVWGSLLNVIGRFASPHWAFWRLAALIFLAFGLRLYFFDKALDAELRTGEAAAPSKCPEAFYFVAFCIIGVLLATAVPDAVWLVPAAIGAILLGASMMSTFRRGPRTSLRFWT